MLGLIIRGGQVVTSEGVAQRDLGIQGDQIAEVALPGTLDVEAGRTIDATGKVVLPGGIEPHTPIGITVIVEAAHLWTWILWRFVTRFRRRGTDGSLPFYSCLMPTLFISGRLSVG